MKAWTRREDDGSQRRELVLKPSSLAAFAIIIWSALNGSPLLPLPSRTFRRPSWFELALRSFLLSLLISKRKNRFIRRVVEHKEEGSER